MAVKYAILNIGQSNGQPTAPLADYLALTADLNVGILALDAANANLNAYYGRAVETIRFLTMFNPEQTAAFPGGSPPAPFATFDKYGLFLPWTALEGRRLNSLLTRTDTGAGTANQVVTTAGTFSAGDVGTKWIRITSAGPNLNQRRLISAVVGTDTAQWVTALPAVAAGLNFSVNNLASQLTNPNALSPGAPVPTGGTGFCYPNAFARPRGPLYDETVEPLGQLVAAYTSHVSMVVDVAYKMAGWLKKPVHVINVGIESSQLQFTEQPIPTFSKWGWFDPKL